MRKASERQFCAVASRLYDYLKEKGLTKVAVFNDSNAYGVSGKEQLEDLAPSEGMTIVAKESYGSKDTDMSTQLTKIKGSGAQALIVWGSNPGPAIITKNARQLNLGIPILQSAGVANEAFIELAGDAANGVILPTSKMLIVDELPASDPQKSVLTQFRDTYKAKYGTSPDTFAGNAFDAFHLIAKAIESNGPTRAKIRDGIESVKNMVGINGIFNMSPSDHNGLTKGGFVMIEIIDRKWKLAK
ncbi:MAG: ABC transporter substrate-binding protein [Dehalococcoidales bacterium]|nr:ABC transporter substrate-binding protein [Dehalococcoidales bacterium]